MIAVTLMAASFTEARRAGCGAGIVVWSNCCEEKNEADQEIKCR